MNKFKYHDFKQLRTCSSRFETEHCVFSYASCSQFKFAINIGRKCGCAVVRNKIKRRIKHIIRTIKHKAVMLLIICKKQISHATYYQLQEQIQNFMKNT